MHATREIADLKFCANAPIRGGGAPLPMQESIGVNQLYRQCTDDDDTCFSICVSFLRQVAARFEFGGSSLSFGFRCRLLGLFASAPTAFRRSTVRRR